MFGFGFDTAAKIILTRGDQYRKTRDYSTYLRIKEIENAFGALQKLE